MRFCYHCRRWNTGKNLRCRYCAHTFGVRLCPAGHINPPDTEANFCATCGRPDLSQPTLPPRSLAWIFRVFKWGGIVLIIIIFIDVAADIAPAISIGGLAIVVIPLILLTIAIQICSRTLHVNIGRAILRSLWKLISKHPN